MKKKCVSGMPRGDRIRNEYIRGSVAFKVDKTTED